MQQSHGGSSKQALAVAKGLQADVVTMNQTSDIELLEKKGLVKAGWRSRLPDNAVPFTSTTVFLVRKGNPKQVRDWADLAKDNLQIVIANPKTTGNGRYAFLGAFGYGLKANTITVTKPKSKPKSLLPSC
ncbi:sulfate-binding family protein [Neisseria musculi]|uniref:Sulfate ABC transporter sulfate-binding family protein n=1 Tax=Neisseria musculi TaxID=1815583 RepID=A0A7H1MBF0_9NEIS|nr:sulfate ABC transporter, sulfate-binding family protein [Neisseria musculi]